MYKCSINSLRPSDAYVLINLAIVSSNNGLLPIWCQIIIWTDDGLVSTGPLRTNLSEILIKLQWLSYKKWFGNVFCKMETILSQPQCVNALRPRKHINAIWRFHHSKYLPVYQNFWMDPNSITPRHHILIICTNNFMRIRIPIQLHQGTTY